MNWIAISFIFIFFLSGAESWAACREVNLGNVKLNVKGDEAEPALTVQFPGGGSEQLPLPARAPGARCLALKTLPPLPFVIVQFDQGEAGTSVLVQRETLEIYALEGGKINFKKSIDLQVRERTSAGTNQLVAQTYQLKAKDKRLEIILTNPKGQVQREWVESADSSAIKGP